MVVMDAPFSGLAVSSQLRENANQAHQRVLDIRKQHIATEAQLRIAKRELDDVCMYCWVDLIDDVNHCHIKKRIVVYI